MITDQEIKDVIYHATLSSNIVGNSKDMDINQKRFELAKSIAPAVYQDDRALKRKIDENEKVELKYGLADCNIREIARETWRLADAILEAECEKGGDNE